MTTASAIPDRPSTLFLYGAGRVGTAVAQLLAKRGYTLTGVASRSAESAGRAARRLGVETVDVQSGAGVAGTILIGAPATVIEALAQELAPHVALGAAVVHFSGSLGVAPLASVVTAGAHAVALHPVQACPDVDTALRRLPGSAWGVTCTEGMREWARAVVEEDLSGAPVFVREEHRPVWHAAAVTTSNGIAALLGLGEAMLTDLGIPLPEAVLGPLAAGTLANAREGGGGGATLTGPVVRGEVETVRRHLEALRTISPELVDAYGAAVRMIVMSATRSMRIDDAAAESLGRLWDESWT